MEEKLRDAVEAVKSYMRAGSDKPIAIAYAAADYGLTVEAVREAVNAS